MNKIYSKVVINNNSINNSSKIITQKKQIPKEPTISLDDKLFNQKAILRIGSLVISNQNIDFTFDIPFDDDVEVNEATIEIYNLSKSSLNLIKKSEKIVVEAGYGNDVGIIFSGYISKKVTTYENVDKKTTIIAIDGQGKKDKKIKSLSYKKGVKASYILKDLIKLTGLDVGSFNIKRDYVYKSAVTVDGELMSNIQKYAKVCNVSTYVCKGKVYVRNIREKSGDDINFIIQPSTGLLEIEEFEEEETNEKYKDQINGYNIKMLLCSRIQTASLVSVKSNLVNGKYYVKSGNHSYDGTEFLTELKLI